MECRSGERAEQLGSAAAMSRLDPRVPSNLECDWLQNKLHRVGRGQYLSAKTLSDETVDSAPGLRKSINRELLMSASSGGVASPREFSRVRRLRASLLADRQVAARRRKRQAAQRPPPRSPRSAAEAAAQAAQEEEEAMAREEAAQKRAAEAATAAEQASNARPQAGVGQIVRIRTNLVDPAYGWGHLHGNAMGRVLQIRHICRPQEPDKKEWHYLIELLESPYDHAASMPRAWVSQTEIEGRRRNTAKRMMSDDEMKRLAPTSSTDWARIERLATPKSRTRAGLGEAQSSAQWSQSSAQWSQSDMASTLDGSMDWALDQGFDFPFAPATSPRAYPAPTWRASLPC